MRDDDFKSARNAAKMINSTVWCDWVEDALIHMAEFASPPKPWFSQSDGDYFYFLPVMHDLGNVAIVKMIDHHGKVGQRRIVTG